MAPIFGRDADDLAVPFRGRTIDLAPPFARVTILGSVSDAVGEPVTLDHPDLRTLAQRHGVHVDDAWGPGKIVQELFEKLVEPTIERPTFVCDFPREVSPLARPHRDDPGLTEHFDLVVGGLELVTAFSELTDPIEQRAKFELQQQMQGRAGRRGPSAGRGRSCVRWSTGCRRPAGWAWAIDRLLMLLTDAPSLRDLIMFPQPSPRGRGVGLSLRRTSTRRPVRRKPRGTDG